MQTLKQHLRKLTKDQFKELNQLCLHSNSLYNCALYTIKKYYEETNEYLTYNKLYHIMKSNIHYKKMNTRLAQQTLRLVDKDYRSFFALLNRKVKGQYAGEINPPKFKKPKTPFILIIPFNQISLKNNLLKITKKLRIPFNYKIDGIIKQAIIKPKGNKYYEIYITYEENKIEQKEKNKETQNNCLSIDLGLNNLATCFNNVGHNDFIINGKPLKAYNQFYNKIKAKIQSELKVKNNKFNSNKLKKININRDNFINNYFNQAVNKIIKYCLKYNINKIIIGYNETWKNEIDIGKKNNQNFVSIPHFKFKQKLRNKCLFNNIEFIQINESYTSKCSALDLEEIKKHENYLGKRIKRGLFQGTKYKINADVNGAINIMRKAIGDDLTFVKSNSIERCIVHPVKFNTFGNEYDKTNKHIFN